GPSSDDETMIKDVTCQRLSARPCEGPEGRGKAERSEFLLSVLPQRHRFRGKMQPDFGNEHRRNDLGVLLDKALPRFSLRHFCTVQPPERWLTRRHRSRRQCPIPPPSPAGPKGVNY